MWPRRRIDLGGSDLLFAAWECCRPSSDHAAVHEQVASTLEACWSDAAPLCVTLSARSGFDLLLAALQLPAGSEVLVSAVTIPDMLSILKAHGLVPVPIELDFPTLAPLTQSIESRITPRTRAILIAHLFGSCIDLDPLVELAKRQQLLLIEDCAQTFSGRMYRGHPEADAVLFSFGPIKTATALGGGVLRLRDTSLHDKIQQLHRNWPVQSRFEYLRRVFHYTLLKGLGCKLAFTCFVTACRWLGVDFAAVLSHSVRNFAKGDLLKQMRRQPCCPLSRLIQRRIVQFDDERLLRRMQIGDQLARKFAARRIVPGRKSSPHVWWVFPVSLSHPTEIAAEISQIGFDVAVGSQLVAVPAPPEHPDWTAGDTAERLTQLVFLPNYPELPDTEVERMTEAILAIIKAGN